MKRRVIEASKVGPDFYIDNTQNAIVVEVREVNSEIINTIDLSRRPALCGATFKEHCQYPKCDCDRSEHGDAT